METKYNYILQWDYLHWVDFFLSTKKRESYQENIVSIESTIKCKKNFIRFQTVGKRKYLQYCM